MEEYQNAKQNLCNIAKVVKAQNPKDKAYCREVINNNLDSMCKQIDFWAMKGNYSERKARQYKSWLSNLACKLHPK